jgi:hypothetical protein
MSIKTTPESFIEPSTPQPLSPHLYKQIYLPFELVSIVYNEDENTILSHMTKNQHHHYHLRLNDCPGYTTRHKHLSLLHKKQKLSKSASSELSAAIDSIFSHIDQMTDLIDFGPLF